MTNREESRILTVILCSGILILGVVATPCFSQDDNKIQRIADAILWVVTPPERFEERRARPYYGTRAYKDPEYRTELAAAFDEASKFYDLPVSLLVGMGYRESIFRTNEVGPKGELGIMQVGKLGRRTCKCIDIDTVKGGIMCGACWLDMGRKRCENDIKRGLSTYVSGPCEPRTSNGKWAVRVRMRLWKKLKPMIELKGRSGE